MIFEVAPTHIIFFKIGIFPVTVPFPPMTQKGTTFQESGDNRRTGTRNWSRRGSCPLFRYLRAHSYSLQTVRVFRDSLPGVGAPGEYISQCCELPLPGQLFTFSVELLIIVLQLSSGNSVFGLNWFPLHIPHHPLYFDQFILL